MSRLIIRGGNILRGEVQISGAKNAILPLMAATILFDEPLILHNIARLGDVVTMEQLLQQMGVAINREGVESYYFDASRLSHTVAPYEMVRAMRASILVLGPLLAKHGHAQVAMPGGCAIGARPVDRHIDALRAMGADIHIENGYIHAQGALKGAIVGFDEPTVTGTENIMMAAVLAKGTTTIHGCAKEPEVSVLAECLNQFGAKISGAGTDTIHVEGVKQLNGGQFTVMGDRIEAMTYAVAAVMTGGSLRLNGITPQFCQSALNCLALTGADILTSENSIQVNMNYRAQAVDVTTAPYPDFPTDAQAQFMAMNCIAEGDSIIRETIFENRFMHVQELQRLGAKLECQHDKVICHGVETLVGAPVQATDLRASACLVLAGLVAEGETVVEQIQHLDRGYVSVEEKLQAVGADIERSEDDCNSRISQVQQQTAASE